MSLFGSLFSGVSALNAQSQAMGIISDNIANLNTTGFKATTARFETLVTTAATETTFSPGGVRTRPVALVDHQGLVQASASPTDLAISGQGFFVVNSSADLSGSVLYTRAGSFRQDNLGNLVNTAGFYLQGWRLDPDGRIPGEPGNLTNTTSSADLASLETINVGSINGAAAATTSVSMGANLGASQSVLLGPRDITTASGVTSTTDLGAAPVSLTSGDTFTVANGTGVLGTFEYNPALGASQFTTLLELADLINAVTGLQASLGGPVTDVVLTVTGSDPGEDLVITNTFGTAGTALFGGTSPLTTVQSYDATDSTKNMASDSVGAHFSRAVRIFDAQGTGHDLQVSFLKVGNNTWAIEIFARPPTDVSVSSPLVDGQIATGEVTFNGDGSLASVSSTLSSPSPVVWTTGASASTISFDFGTAGPLGTGLTDGLSQFAGGFNVAFVNQNGSEVGQLNGISINEEGFVIASFSNGETQRVYKLPIATFADVSRLEARTGNVYARTQESGEFNLHEAGKGRAGSVAPSALEAANVDIGQEFTNMIITQRAFAASSRVITTVDDMLDELIRIRR